MAEAMNYMWMSRCFSDRKKLRAGLHAENHNQIIGQDSSSVYQAVTKGNYCLKIAKRQSYDNLRCLITDHSKPVGP